MIERQLTGKQISRREFLTFMGKALMVWVGGGVVGSISGKIFIEQTNIMLPDSPSASNQLKATALNTELEGEQAYFVPEGKFTKELFDKVRNSTYAIDTLTDRGIGSGTGWCAHKEGNNVYIVTNKHVTTLVDQPDAKIIGLNIWRPNIDRKKIAPLNVTVVTAGTDDIAILKCELSPEQAQAITPLAFQDNAEIKSNEKILIVGFPAEFRDITTDGINFLTLGNVATVEWNADKQTRIWYARGLSNDGSSGSPAVIPDEQGNPKVVGILFGGADVIVRENWREKRKQPIIGSITLSINPLIEYARKIQF
ncbi:MAG: hypothetical protein A3B47_03705 [Candidatus Levybacteria bacterium RIFCSPLOWO2_01_FULL_39_24]|nr:MAG: hypothetical protein A2800_03510 [Candidatus Levybacteria bacterium RIFCSPHIGHO2_01_FULL_40_16]OGH46345.1 MAG: hypothetical protein A3B47_03705 [Candidatus Levybacteria bacterium RIFCSPLOWO2_01_FULL_39_24]